jgi:DNA-binding LacI/PurR family transcriptional regulator
MAAIQELSFEPNRMARGLRGVPSQLIGICFQELEAPLLAYKANVLLKYLRDHHYRGLLELTAGDQNLETTIVRHFLSVNVDGIILVGSTLHPKDPLVLQLVQNGTPVAAVDPEHALPFPKVRLNRKAAMENIFQHLYDLGHRKFGLLGIPSKDQYGKARLDGIHSAIEKLGLDWKRDFVSISLPDYNLQDFRYGAALSKEFLKLPKPLPSALIALNDRLAIAISRHLQEAGYRIPEDFSLVGFDNLEIASWSRPNLTTIDQDVSNLMGKAASILLKEIDKGRSDPPLNVEISPILIKRESTGYFLC